MIKEVVPYIQKLFQKMGTQLVYASLLMYHAYNAKGTPAWAKNVIIGALAYFVSPIDGIPDLSPFIGFTDDMGILSFGLVTIACYINDDVKVKARIQLANFFKDFREEDIEQVEEYL